MPDDPKKIAEALKKIEALNQEVKRLGGVYFQDVNKAVESFGGGLKGAQQVIKTLISESNDLKDSFDNVSTTLKNIVDDMGGMAKASRLINRGFDKLETSARKLAQHKDDEYILSVKQIKAEQQKQKLIVKDLEYQLTRLGNSTEDLKIRKELEAQLVKEVGVVDRLNKLTQDTLDTEIKIQKTLGLTGQAFKGIAGTLQQIGVESESIEEINLSMRKAAKEGSGLKVIFEGIKGSAKAAFETLTTDPAAQLAFLTKTFKTLYDLGANFSKDTANIARELGMSNREAAILNREFYDLQQNSNDAFGNQKNFLQSTLELNEALGTSATFSADVLATQARIAQVTGLTAEESAEIYKFSLLTGQTQEEIYDSVGAINKGNLNNKKVLQEVLKTNGQLAAQYKNNPKEIGKAVVQAQKLGLTLKQTQDISRNLLNFEESISAELEAELLTGEDLNLERARYLALMGDSAGAATELMKNLGPNGLAKFQKMNVIQQEAYAKSLGMSVDELADSLVKQNQLSKLGTAQQAQLKERIQKLKEAGETEKAAELEKQVLAGKNVTLAEQQLDAQAKIAQATETFKSSIQAVVAGPLGFLADKVAGIMESINKSPFAKMVLGGLGAVGAVAAAATSVFLIGKTLVNSFKNRPTGTPNDRVYTSDLGGTPGTGGGIPTGGGGFGGGLGGRGLFGKGGYAKDLLKGGRAGKVARGRTMRGLTGGLGKGLGKGLVKRIPLAGAILGAGMEFAEGGFNTETVGRAALSGLGTFGGGLLGSAVAPGVGTFAGGVAGGMAGDALGDLIFGEREEMATGGIVTKPTRALVGEAGAEAVIPLDKLMAEFKEMRAILTQIASREGTVYLDGTKVGTAMAMSTYKTQ